MLKDLSSTQSHQGKGIVSLAKQVEESNIFVVDRLTSSRKVAFLFSHNKDTSTL